MKEAWIKIKTNNTEPANEAQGKWKVNINNQKKSCFTKI